MGVTTISINIAETDTSIVSLTAATEHADFPLTRLYDRSIRDIFKTTAAETTEIQIDQSASGNIEIAGCVIAAGHNLDGETIDIQHSPAGSVWTNAVTQFTGSAGNIIKTFTPITKRYWRLKITSPSNAVEIPELFFSPLYVWETDPVYPLVELDDSFNVQTVTDAKGENYYYQKGIPKRTRKYALRLITEAQKVNLNLLWANWGGVNPFWILDHEAVLFYTEIIGRMNLRANIKTAYNADIEFLEVLGI